MAEIIVMPKMNLIMEEGVLGRWYKSEGDCVSTGDPLCSVENEKETSDVEASVSGTILKIWGEEGEKYAVSRPIALIGNPDEDISEITAEIEKKTTGNAAPAVAVQEKESPRAAAVLPAANIKMLPKLRKMIRDRGIDLQELIAYAGKERLTEQDILRFEAERATDAVPDQGRRERISTMRRAIMNGMTESCEKTARLTNITEADMSVCLARIAGYKKEGKNTSVTAMVIKACAMALREYPILNASIDGDEIVYHNEINIGCAVDIPGGLVVPVIRHADKRDIFKIAAEISDFSDKGRDSKLTSADMSGGNFTVSNVGMLGVDVFTPIINYPQSSIMGIGAITRLPRYLDKTSEIPVPRHIMKLCLTYDHRIIDGAPAARFSLMVRELLENPLLLQV